MKTPLIIITGYLGAGKTSLLKHLMTALTQKYAIIMNEFGEIGIDNQIIKGKNIDMIELSGGCVCCSLTGEFEEAIKELQDKINPEVIIVETTGVAEADALILEVEDVPSISVESVITVVDADAMNRFPEIGHVGQSQIEQADILLLNKTDLVEPQSISKIRERVQSLNSTALFLSTTYGVIDPNLVVITPHRKKQSTKIGHTGIESFSLTSPKKLQKEKVLKFLKTLPEQFYRIKGFIDTPDGSILVNKVAGRLTVENTDQHETQLVFIGKEIKPLHKSIQTRLANCG